MKFYFIFSFRTPEGEEIQYPIEARCKPQTEDHRCCAHKSQEDSDRRCQSLAGHGCTAPEKGTAQDFMLSNDTADLLMFPVAPHETDLDGLL